MRLRRGRDSFGSMRIKEEKVCACVYWGVETQLAGSIICCTGRPVTLPPPLREAANEEKGCLVVVRL